MDNSLSSYFAMKGLIDLRVANVLAKQAMLHNMAASEQAALAHSLGAKAARLTSIADEHEKQQTPSTYEDDLRASNLLMPARGSRYTPHPLKPPILSLLTHGGLAQNRCFFPTTLATVGCLTSYRMEFIRWALNCIKKPSLLDCSFHILEFLT